MSDITADRVRGLFSYRDGALYWLKRVNSKVAAGSRAGTVNNLGYVVITIDGKKIHAHRLIWLWHGHPLPVQLDHMNGIVGDNRVENLRAADYVTNACNSKVRSDNTSGVKGVSWCTTFNKWAVQIRRGSVLISRKFKTLEEAANFAREKRAELHGEFACEGNR